MILDVRPEAEFKEVSLLEFLNQISFNHLKLEQLCSCRILNLVTYPFGSDHWYKSNILIFWYFLYIPDSIKLKTLLKENWFCNYSNHICLIRDLCSTIKHTSSSSVSFEYHSRKFHLVGLFIKCLRHLSQAKLWSSNYMVILYLINVIVICRLIHQVPLMCKYIGL